MSGKIIKLTSEKEINKFKNYSDAYHEGFERGKEAREYQIKDKYENDIRELKSKLNREAKDLFDAAYKLGKKEEKLDSDVEYKEKIKKIEKIIQSIRDLISK